MVDAMTRRLSTHQRDLLSEVAEREGASLLVLFGSMREGAGHPDSDVDLAVDLDREADLDTQLHLIRALEAPLSGLRVDLVVLSPATPPLLRYEIFSRGECLFERASGRFDTEYLRAWHLYLDTRRLRDYERAYLRYRAAGGPHVA